MSGFSHESWISAGKKWQPELKRISRYSGICRIGPSQWYMTRPTNWEADFPIFNYTFYPSVWVPGFTKSSDSIMKENERKKKKKVNWRRFKPEFSSLEDRISTFSLTDQSYSHETEAFQYTEKL